MKKTYLSLILLSSVLLFWCSLNPKNVINLESWTTVDKFEDINEDTLIYESKSENFIFNFKKERTFEENKFWFNTIVFTPKDDEINENVWIAVQKLQKFLSVEEYYEETIKELKSTIIWFKETKTENISKQWLNGKKIIYDHQADDRNLKSQQTFLISKDNVVYSIVYTSTKENFNKFLKWADIIVDSFKLKE
jgi:hypothetical protein